MLNFLQSRGCVLTFNSNGTAGGYQIQGFPKGSDGRPIVLTEADTSFKDLVLPVTTLSNKKILYTFGSDFGQASFSGIIFLGKAGESSAGIAEVKTWYDTNSTGNKKNAKPVKVSLNGTDVISVYIIGLVLGKPNAELNFIPFTLVAVQA